MKVRLLLVAVALALSMVPMGHACSCRGEESVLFALRRSQGVFVGRVTHLEWIPGRKLRLQGRIVTGISHSVATVRVERSWKGPRQGQTVRVSTGPTGRGCGYPFEEKKRYLIYATSYRRDDMGDSLSTGICDRTSSVERAEEDFATLGKPLKQRRFGLF